MGEHQSVLLQESISGLNIKADGIYVDGTFGRGGHSRLILEHLNASGRLIAIDKDEEAINHANAHFADDPRFTIVRGSFANIRDIAEKQGVMGRIDGILLDLGVSSPQLDNPERGFSFMNEGPLDMRMDTEQFLDAKRYVNTAEASDMEKVFREYGEERFARRISRAIVAARDEKPFETTAELAEVVKAANPKWEKHKHPATRVFQAIRIHINEELTDLSACLKHCLATLSLSGRLVVISFHSLEDRIVKQFMRAEEQGPEIPIGVPIKSMDLTTCFKRIGKAIKPNPDEIKHNSRSRSAVLRIGEKTA